MQERQGQWRVFVERDGMEVEQVGFDGEGVGSKGGTVPDIRDSVEGFAGFACANGQGRNVDAVCGKKLIVWSEVDRGHGVTRTVAASRRWRADDRKAAPQ